MSENLPFVSVIIPTINRPQAIVDAVNDFRQQDYPNFEIIVVAQEFEKNGALERIAAQDQRVQIIKADRTGTCRARNTGVRAAKGDIVLFVDDDVRIKQTDFIAVHARNYADPKIGGVGGRVTDQNQKLNRQQSGPVCWVSKTGRVYPNATSMRRQEINAPRGGNMSFRTSIIAQVGWFDENFRGNAIREETDFSLRVWKVGWKIIYDPDSEILHLALPGGTRSVGRIQWYRDFFFNESYFFLKHFSRWLLPLLLFRKIRPIVVCAVYYGHLSPAALAAPWKAFGDAWRIIHQPKIT